MSLAAAAPGARPAPPHLEVSGVSEDSAHSAGEGVQTAKQAVHRSTLLARIASGQKGGWSSGWMGEMRGPDSHSKKAGGKGNELGGRLFDSGEQGTIGRKLGGRYSQDAAGGRKLCGKTGIGLKGGVAHLVELLGRQDSPTAPGTRLRSALTLEQLAELEDAVVLMAAIGPGVAGPVVALFTGASEGGGTMRERAACAGILTWMAKMPRLQSRVATAPGLAYGLEALLVGEGAGPESQHAACKLLTELGGAGDVTGWAAGRADVLGTLLELATGEPPEDAGVPETAMHATLAAGSIWALSALAREPSAASALLEPPRLARLVALSTMKETGSAAAALLAKLAEDSAGHEALAAAKTAPALMERVRRSNGDRATLLTALRGLAALAEHPPSGNDIIRNHGSAMISELLLFVRNEDDELLLPMVAALRLLSAKEENHSVMMHDGIILQLLPLLQYGSVKLAVEVAGVLANLAGSPSCSRSVVGTGGIALLTNRLLGEEGPPPSPALRCAITQALTCLSQLPENRSPVARFSLPTLISQVSLSMQREVQTATCGCLAVLATSSELKDAFLSIGLVDRLLNLIASDSDRPLGEQTELGMLGVGGKLVAHATIRALMEELTGELRSEPRVVMAWLLAINEHDKQEAAVRVVAKMPPAAAPALMAAEPTLVSTLSGPPARAAVMDAGTAPLLVQMLQMQTAETRVPGTRLLQRLADDEDARVVLVEAGAIEALLDQIEHAPDSTGRVSAAKALTNLSLSTACRSVMTARGLQPLVEMLRPDVSEPEGQQTALRALQNMCANRENAQHIQKAATGALMDILLHAPVSVKVAGAKLVYNIACHEGLDQQIAPAVIPVIDELLVQEELSVVQIACQLIDCLTQRPQLRKTWQSNDVSDRLIKILLLGDAAGRYYAAQALEKLGVELAPKLGDRKEAALMVDPALLKSPSSMVKMPAAGRATAYSGGERHQAAPEPEESTSSSVSSAIVGPKTHVSIGRPPLTVAPTTAAAQPQGRSSRRALSAGGGAAGSPPRTAAESPRTTSSRSLLDGDDGKGRRRQRPPSPLARGEAKKVAEPSGPVEPKKGFGWEHRGPNLRSSVDGVAINAALDRLAVPGMQASLASMTSATMLSSTGPRTTRAAKELWTDVRSVVKMLGLKKQITSAATKALTDLGAAKTRMLERRRSGTAVSGFTAMSEEVSRRATFQAPLPEDEGEEAAGDLPAAVAVSAGGKDRGDNGMRTPDLCAEEAAGGHEADNSPETSAEREQLPLSAAVPEAPLIAP
eukprot:jgi/Tetstr1/425309/TSEL_015759.t2